MGEVFLSVPARSMPARPCGEARPLAWWVVPLLALPTLIPAARSYQAAYSQGKVATGFIYYEMPYYMANGREHFDQGFQLTYGNPYASYDTPAIYFQPQTFLLGCLQRAGLDPGLALNLFGLATLFFAAWVAARLYEEMVGLETRAKRLALICFFWGGGIRSLAGVAAGMIQHKSPQTWTLFGPANGWWQLNFGRNLVYPTEAYYHALFLFCLFCLIRRKFAVTLVSAALLSMSHPFTGLTLALILVVYSSLELLLKTRAATGALFAGSLTILILHVAYYVVFLNRFADHRALQSQWELAWLYKPSMYVPALFIVGCLAVARLVRGPGLRAAVEDGRVRLFAVCFLVVFALTQHNLLIKPRQPIHFAHGYDWVALFFIGAPVLVSVLERFQRIPHWYWRNAALALFIGFVLLDNLTWYGSFFVSQASSWTLPSRDSLMLTNDQRSVLAWIDRNTAPPEMVISQDSLVGYLVSTYTRVRSWEGHYANTPFSAQRTAEVRQAFLEGLILPEWNRQRVYYVVRRDTEWSPPLGVVERYRNNEFVVWGPQ